jgi:hypothetical protein
MAIDETLAERIRTWPARKASRRRRRGRILLLHNRNLPLHDLAINACVLIRVWRPDGRVFIKPPPAQKLAGKAALYLPRRGL